MSGIWEMNAWSLIKAGGPIMAPILLCSFLALSITIEKLFYFASIKTNVNTLKRSVFDSIKNNKITDAIQICDSSRSPVAKIFKSGIIKFGYSREAIKESMEDASLFEIPRLESRLTALATIAHISPLLGLLGTVTGMTASFHTIQVRAASLNPVTPGDLPTFVVYNYLVNRVNHFILDMERGATELLNFMCQITESGSRE